MTGQTFLVTVGARTGMRTDTDSVKDWLEEYLGDDVTVQKISENKPR